MADPASNEVEIPQTTLTQAEVDRLLALVSEEANTGVQPKAPAGAKAKASPIQHFDFRQPLFLAASELRKLRVHHEAFIRSLAARLSVYLRLDFSLQLSGLNTIGFEKYLDNLANPSHLTLFRVEPLHGVCVIDTPIRFGLPMVDRLLGGPGLMLETNRDFSEIEVALLDQVIQIMISEWCSQWFGFQELRPIIVGHESDPRFIPGVSPDTMMLAVTMDATMRDCVDHIRIAFPYHTVEPLVRKLTSQLESGEPSPEAGVDKRPKWNPRLKDMPMTLSAEWGAFEMTARQLANLKIGDVINLSPSQTQSVELRLERLPKFRGRLGTQGTKWAVELTEVIQS